MTRAGESALECERPQWWGAGSGLAGLQAKVALAGVSLLCLETGSPSEGQSLPGQQAPDVRASTYRNKMA